MSSPLISYLVAVVEIADAISDGVHKGLCCLMSAAIPAIWGVAILVPDSSAKSYPKQPDKVDGFLGLKYQNKIKKKVINGKGKQGSTYYHA